MNFKIHFLWAVVTVVAAAIWGQMVGRTRETEFLERERILRVKGVEATAAARILPPPAAPAPVPVLPPDAPLVLAPATPAREYELQQEEMPTVEELRRMMQQGNDVWRAHQVINRMVKCPLKTQLLRELFAHQDPQVRRAVLHQLQDAIGAEAATPLLQECLRADPAVDVRESAAQMLGYQDAPGNLAALLQAFQKDELKVQLVCAAALADQGQTGPAAQLIPRFAALLDSSDGALRREAVASLSQLRCPQAMPLLARALRDTNGDVRFEAVNSLWNTDDPAIVALLEPLANDPVEMVRDAVKTFLEEVKAKKE